MKKNKIVQWSVIGIFVGLYLLVSTVSTFHLIDFFQLSNTKILGITLAVAFELGSVACLAALLILDKTSKSLVYILFIIITLIQIIGNVYFSYVHLGDIKSFSQLVGIDEEDIIFQKRVVSILTGAILPIVALGFIKSLVDYIKPSDNPPLIPPIIPPVIETPPNIPPTPPKTPPEDTEKPSIELKNESHVSTLPEIDNESEAPKNRYIRTSDIERAIAAIENISSDINSEPEPENIKEIPLSSIESKPIVESITEPEPESEPKIEFESVKEQEGEVLSFSSEIPEDGDDNNTVGRLWKMAPIVSIHEGKDEIKKDEILDDEIIIPQTRRNIRKALL